MMRSVDTRFWEDGWVRKLNALDRYMFLYFLTNTHTNWCGVYELDMAMMAFESGIDKEDLERAMLPRLSPKVIYVEGWVYIPNFAKYHNSNSADAKKGFERAFGQIPERIRSIIEEIELQGGTGGSRVPSSSAFTSTLTSKSKDLRYEIVEKTTEVEKEPRAKAKYPHSKEVFGLWGKYPANWIRNTTQLIAAENLYAERGLTAIRDALEWYETVKDQPYCPTMTSPYDLDSKWAKLDAFSNRK